MKIQLPKNFEYWVGSKLAAYVKDDKLYMRIPINFEAAMRSLTYALKGNTVCAYCKKTLGAPDEPKCTLDHVYPKSLGGISIPNNLKPVCFNCNSEKANLLPHQYRKVMQITNLKEKKETIKAMMKENDIKKRKQGILIPKSWYEKKDDYYVLGSFNSKQSTKIKSYRAIYEQFIEYGQICKPVVLSANNVVLDGFSVLLLDKTILTGKAIPFIVLENVFAEI